MLSPVRLSSVCRLSVTFVRPTKAVQIFGNMSTALGTLAMENFTEIVPGEALRGGVKHKRGSQIYRFRTYRRLSRKRCKIEGKLLLIANRKSYMSFRLVPKSVTLNDLERRNGRYFALFHRIRLAFGAHCVKVVEDIPKLSTTET